MTIAAIPSPSTAVWHVGPLPIRAYALCIVLGIIVACAVTEVRLRRRGAPPYAVLDVSVWAVPFGIVGARIYHVLSSPQDYFGAGGEPIRALYIWEGGLGIWGAVAGGAVGAWLGCRQVGIPLVVFADALAPGLPLAQAVGRFGNWFNNELHGGPTTLPWGLEVHRMDPNNPGRALLNEDRSPELLPGLYHPAFAYEALWCVGVAVVVWLVDRRLKLGRGRAFALYVIGYTVGRFWIELIRTDPANEIAGVRLNVWTAVVVFIGAVAYFVRVRGPQEFLVPAEPVGYRAVTEDEFRTYQHTGVAPAGDTVVDGSADADGPDGDGPDGDGPDGDGPDGDGGEEDSADGGAGREGGPGNGAVTAAGDPNGADGGPDDDDDGADLVDAAKPPLDDFADDAPDDADEVDDDGDDDEEDAGGGPAADAVKPAGRPVRSADDR